MVQTLKEVADLSEEAMISSVPSAERTVTIHGRTMSLSSLRICACLKDVEVRKEGLGVVADVGK
jgi:hypothetical protein